MAVKGIHGVPGTGKTLLGTIIGVNHYEKENKLFSKVLHFIGIKLFNFRIFRTNLIRKLLRKRLLSYKSIRYDKSIFNEYGKINNVYANYPILLDDKLNIYSNIVSIYDINNEFKFLPYSVIILDEFQLSFDSDEYQDKRINAIFKPIARFMQAHRHYGIKDIYIISQHPSRVMKKARNVAEVFIKINHFFKIPFIHLGIMTMIEYYTFEDYGKSVKVKKELINFDFKKRIKFFKYRKYFDRYDTCYLRANN